MSRAALERYAERRGYTLFPLPVGAEIQCDDFIEWKVGAWTKIDPGSAYIGTQIKPISPSFCRAIKDPDEQALSAG